ncbi:MAG: pyruvate dehydrogenase (acetyl-transferring) E1 component subunit alpha, partial [Rhizobiales bacterium]|nr:pyruvate dehydrogenase (acetyl-transferring) E1 component subunit alpha [Hyphomicrobiales bacterium]
MASSCNVHTVAHFEINCHCCLDAAGRPCGTLPLFAQNPDRLRKLYRAMALTRAFDEKAIALQRTGRLGTYASSLGQEAVGVGIASAMIDEDVLLPSFREHGAQLVRGVSLKELLLYWGGDERGSAFEGPDRDFPVCIPVASHFPHAAGVGLALKLKGRQAAAVCIAGDGATSKGDFYEAINIAGAWSLPVLFVIANNQWAISVSRAAQTKTRTLAQKAIAAGIETKQVDGNDVIGVTAVTDDALKSIRKGGGPQLIEALTYRLGDHTTADDSRRYRDDDLVSKHWKEEPLIRLRTYLVEQGWWTSDDEHELLTDCTQEVAAAAEAYLETPAEPTEAIFKHLFA